MFGTESGNLNGGRVARRRRGALLCSAALIAMVVSPVAGLATPKAFVSPRPALAARATASRAADAVVADFNGDRHLDIVEASSGGGLSVRWGVRKGEYGEATAFAADVSARRVVSADVTADGINDVVAYAPAGTVLWVVPGSASGVFGEVRSTSVPDGIHSIAVGGLAGNGGIDIAVASERTSAVVLLRNRDDRSGFDASVTALPSRALSIGVVKFDTDNSADLVVGLENRSVVGLQAVDGGFAMTVTRTLEFSPDLMTTADFNGDGWADALVASANGEIAAFARGGGSIGEPVVSTLSAPLTKIDAGFIDADGQIDVVGTGGGIAMVFPGVGGGAFGAPRQAVKDLDVENVAVVTSSGGRQSQLAVAKSSGVSVELIETPLNKLAATIPVTNLADKVWECSGNIAVPSLTPAGSLRAAIDAAEASPGPDTIVFNVSTSTPGYSAADLAFHIFLLEPLVIDPAGSDTTIAGDSAPDTNPFGPDVVLQPLNNQGYVAALEDDAPSPPLFPIDAMTINASGCTVSGLVIAGTDFGGFGQEFNVVKCSDPMQMTDVDIVGEQFNNGIVCNGGGNVIVGNFIGTDQRGFGVQQLLPVASNSGAVSLNGGGNRVGGSSFEDRNIIVSSTNGVTCLNSAGNQILGNIIGSDGTSGGRPGGTNPLIGVRLQAASGTVISGNVIGGSSFSGILLTEGCDGTEVANNRIGVNAAGTTTANTDGGIVINASTNTHVGPANIISKNIGIDGVNSGGVVITGSSIPSTGTNVDDNTISENGRNGIIIENGNQNTIGPNNLIASNTLFGVAVSNGTQNQITKNSITNNSGIGINLVAVTDPSTGITPNDATDADTGPNNLLNFPVFTASTATTTTVTVSGTAPGGSVVEIFKSDSKQVNGQGFEFMIQTTATAGGLFSVDLPLTLPLQDSLTLTATATLSFNTSEFGPNFKLNQRLQVSPLSITFPTTAVGGIATAPLTICNTGVSNLTISAVDVAPADGPFTVSDLADNELAPGECVTLTVTFAPTSASNFAGSITITSDDPSADDVVVTLAGTAILGVINVNVTTLLIPQTRIDGSRSAIVTVSNPTAVAVTVTRTEFKRRNSAKVTFTDRNDPFFRAVPSTFTVPAGGSVDVAVTFSPLMPIPTTDTTSIFELPDPGYQTPRKTQTDMTFVVSDSLGISKTVAIKAKVKPDPGITSGGAPSFVDQLDLTLDIFDPDNNLSNARFFFLNEAEIELFRIDNTPGVNKAIKKFAKGMNVPLTFTFTGLSPYAGSLRFLDCVVDDFSGTSSNIIRFRIRYINPKSGPPQMVLEPVNSASFGSPGFGGASPASIFLPPIHVGPSRR